MPVGRFGTTFVDVCNFGRDVEFEWVRLADSGLARAKAYSLREDITAA